MLPPDFRHAQDLHTEKYVIKRLFYQKRRSLPITGQDFFFLVILHVVYYTTVSNGFLCKLHSFFHHFGKLLNSHFCFLGRNLC